MAEKLQGAAPEQEAAATGAATGHAAEGDDAAAGAAAEAAAAAPSNQPDVSIVTAAIVIDAPVASAGGQRMSTRPAAMKVRLRISDPSLLRERKMGVGESEVPQLEGGRGRKSGWYQCMHLFSRRWHIGGSMGTGALVVQVVPLSLLSCPVLCARFHGSGGYMLCFPT